MTTQRLLTATENGEDYDIQQYLVTPECELAGERYGDVLARLRADHSCVPIGLKKNGQSGAGALKKLPSDDTPVEQGDYVLLVLKGESEPGLEALFGTKEGVLNGTRPEGG